MSWRCPAPCDSDVCAPDIVGQTFICLLLTCPLNTPEAHISCRQPLGTMSMLRLASARLTCPLSHRPSYSPGSPSVSSLALDRRCTCPCPLRIQVSFQLLVSFHELTLPALAVSSCTLFASSLDQAFICTPLTHPTSSKIKGL